MHRSVAPHAIVSPARLSRCVQMLSRKLTLKAKVWYHSGRVKLGSSAQRKVLRSCGPGILSLHLHLTSNRPFAPAC